MPIGGVQNRLRRIPWLWQSSSYSLRPFSVGRAMSRLSAAESFHPECEKYATRRQGPLDTFGGLARAPGEETRPGGRRVVRHAVVGIDSSRNASGITTSEPVRNLNRAPRWPFSHRPTARATAVFGCGA